MKVHRIIALVLALVMALSLTACGEERSKRKAPAALPFRSRPFCLTPSPLKTKSPARSPLKTQPPL